MLPTILTPASRVPPTPSTAAGSVPASTASSFNRLVERDAGRWAKGMPVTAAPMQENLLKEGYGLLEYSGNGGDCMSEKCGLAPTIGQVAESQSAVSQMMNAVVDKQLAKAELKRDCFVHLSGTKKGNSADAQSDHCDEPNEQFCSPLPDMENLDASGSLLDQQNPDLVVSVGDVAGIGAPSSFPKQGDTPSHGVIIPSVSPDQAASRSSGRNHGLAESLPRLRSALPNGPGHTGSKRSAKGQDGPAIFRTEPGVKQHASTGGGGSLKPAAELQSTIAELSKARDAATDGDDQTPLRTAGLQDWDRMMPPGSSASAAGQETSFGANTQTSSTPTGIPTLHSTIKTSLIGLVRDNSSWAPAIAKTGEAATVSGQSADGVIKMLKIQLQPIELGTVELKLRSVAGDMRIEIQVENERAYRALTSDQSAIASALQGLGGRADSISIHLMENNSATGDGRLNIAERGQHENMGRKHDQNVSDGGDRKPKQGGGETRTDPGENSAGTYI